MIPKIIHYCWFGARPFSRTVKKCLRTWHRHLSDYEFCFWNEQTCADYAQEHHINNPMEHPFVQSAYAAKKYAFVADYVRFWALYHIGGIYLDTDMYVLRSFDALLDAEFFCGWETAAEGAAGQCAPVGSTVSCGALGACALGACALGACARDILKKYDTLIFSEANLTDYVIPRVITPIILQHPEVTIYPYDYFYPYPYDRRMEPNFRKYATPRTLAIHLWDLSWSPWYRKLIQSCLTVWRRLIKRCR
ncbi:MAG: glycosyltransferase family 32 protein [Paludibacteraceae bacterium]